MFNCASFEINFGSFGLFKKTVFFILDPVFVLDEYNRENIRELTRLVTASIFDTHECTIGSEPVSDNDVTNQLTS